MRICDVLIESDDKIMGVMAIVYCSSEVKLMMNDMPGRYEHVSVLM